MWHTHPITVPVVFVQKCYSAANFSPLFKFIQHVSTEEKTSLPSLSIISTILPCWIESGLPKLKLPRQLRRGRHPIKGPLRLPLSIQRCSGLLVKGTMIPPSRAYLLIVLTARVDGLDQAVGWPGRTVMFQEAPPACTPASTSEMIGAPPAPTTASISQERWEPAHAEMPPPTPPPRKGARPSVSEAERSSSPLPPDRQGVKNRGEKHPYPKRCRNIK